MYSYSKETSVNVVRSKRLKKMVGEDNDLTNESRTNLSHLPPSHIYRVNHQAATNKRASVPILEKPKHSNENWEWTIHENGIPEPVWTTRLIMPQSLINLLDATNDEESYDEEMGMEPEAYESDDEDEE